MGTMITVVATVSVLGILIFVHEFGHFLLAKFLGVRVEAFSLGFPPQLLHKRIGDTDYRLSVVPLGGYVKFLGEDPADQIPPELQPYSFKDHPLWHRTLIILAGPAFNLVFALLVFFLVFNFKGIPYLNTVIGQVVPNSPAEAAGLKAGDQLLEVDGHLVNRWEDIAQAIHKKKGRPVSLALIRNEKIYRVEVTPKRMETPDIFGVPTSVVIIGIANRENVAFKTVGLPKAFYQGVVATWGMCALTAVGLYKLLAGEAPLKGLGGPILIAQDVGRQAKLGAAALFQFMAALSVNLFLLNMLPIPVLDGGHLLFAALEGIRRKPVELKHREIAQGMGLMLILALMILVFYQDILRLVNPTH